MVGRGRNEEKGWGGRDVPLVTVVTPVYNGAKFLAECIESVLEQTYHRIEYIIVDNCSTDGSFDIASEYAKKDRRIRIQKNEQFVGIIENHNIAFGQMSPASGYCKVVSADDVIYPACVERMVEMAEAHPSVGIVGSYQMSGSVVKWQGLEYPKTVWPGREVCRRVFLGGEPGFGFGAPTSMLYRACVVRGKSPFYPNASPHADTSACFASLRDRDYGFVYQVLSYERTHWDSESARSAEINGYASAFLSDLIVYGPWFLDEAEFRSRLRAELEGYHRFLAVSMVSFRGKGFWNYHRRRLEELGYPIKGSTLTKALIVKGLREAVNPEQAIRKGLKMWRGRRAGRRTVRAPGNVIPGQESREGEGAGV
jgi:glycosyltransferase involved in cell wall biosynthesis